MQNHVCDSLESRQRKPIMAQAYPGRANKLLRGDRLILWQHAQSGATHLLQHCLYPVLHQVIHPVHQQLQVHCSLKGGETCKEQKKTEGKLVEPHQGPVAAELPGGGRAARCLVLPDMVCSTLTFQGVSAYPKPCRCGRGICRYWETSSWGRSGRVGWRRPPAHSAIMDACCVAAAECCDAILSPVPRQEFIVTHVFNLKFSGNWINKTLQLLYIFIHWFSFPSVIIFCSWPSSIQHYLQNNFNKSRTLLLRIFPEPLPLITSPLLSKIPPLAFCGPPPACSSSTPSHTLSSSSSTADGMWNVFSRFKPLFSMWPSYFFFVFCPLPYHPFFLWSVVDSFERRV